jgi:ribosome recycling factor
MQFDDMKKKLETTLSVLSEDLGMIKTGRAKPSLVEHVMIEAYDGAGKMPLNELSSITAPDTTMLVIQPWDQSVIRKIVQGLSQSDLNLNPVLDGNIIRISIPPLTEERRLEMVKLVHMKIEGGKEMMRDVRNDVKRMVDKQKDTPDVSEDDIKRDLEEMQKIFDGYVEQLQDMGKAKEQELMSL